MKYKPFTSKHITPSRFTSPLSMMGGKRKGSFDNPTQAMIDQARADGMLEMADHMGQMKKYRDHQAKTPQYTPGSSIGDKFNTSMKRIVHNITGPRNPNLVGGTLPVVGGGVKGLVKDVLLDKVGDVVATGIEKYKNRRKESK